MDTSHVTTFRARGYELNEAGMIGHPTFLHYFEEAAIQASAAAGYDLAKYDDLGAAWVMRDIDVEFSGTVPYGEEVQVRTWVSDIARIRSHREFEARRGANGTILARARTEWIFIDVKTLMPKRLPAELVAHFDTNGIPAIEPIEWSETDTQVAEFQAVRHVQRYEIDQMRHVNNVVYLNWLEQHTHDACSRLGLDRSYEKVERHFVQFLQAAQPDDEVLIESHLGRSSEGPRWKHQIRRGSTVLLTGFSLVR